MEQQQQTPKTAYIDLRALNNAFVHNITSAATKITKRCICIPIDDNFIVESSYVSKRTGKEVRTAIAAVKMWALSESDKAKARKAIEEDYQRRLQAAEAAGKTIPDDRDKRIENIKDYNLRLDISDKALNALQQRDPALAARLNFRIEGYDRELAKAHLPYIGTAYDLRHRELPPEQVPTQEISMQDGDGDLPF